MYREEIAFNYKILKGLHFNFKNERTIHINPGLPFHLLKKRYDLLAIGGWDQPANWIALFFANLWRSKILLFGESTLRDARTNNPLLEKMKRYFFRNCHAFAPAGSAAANYFQHLGAPQDKIVISPFPAEHDYFHEQYLRLRGSKKEIKRHKGYPQITILFSGRFVPVKGIDFLLEAFKRLQEQNKEIGLVLLGDGPEKNKYEAYCKAKKIDNVFFEGFVQKEQLPEYYTAADIFVLPSLSEPWGLVVNEAMAFGIPIISTDAAGVTYDLVQDGVNGFVIPAGNSEALYDALKKLTEDAKLRERMGSESLLMIENHTPEKWAQSFIRAVQTAMK
ncbi:MAG: glycosyltransferase family 4 protein [Acidobacteriota bacterium]